MVQTVTGYTIHRKGFDSEELMKALERNRPVDDSSRDYFNIWTGKGPEMARTFEPRGISDVVTRTNGERVAEIDSSRLEP